MPSEKNDFFHSNPRLHKLYVEQGIGFLRIVDKAITKLYNQSNWTASQLAIGLERVRAEAIADDLSLAHADDFLKLARGEKTREQEEQDEREKQEEEAAHLDFDDLQPGPVLQALMQGTSPLVQADAGEVEARAVAASVDDTSMAQAMPGAYLPKVRRPKPRRTKS